MRHVREVVVRVHVCVYEISLFIPFPVQMLRQR